MLFETGLASFLQVWICVGGLVQRGYSEGFDPQLLDNKTESILLLACQQASQAQGCSVPAHKTSIGEWSFG